MRLIIIYCVTVISAINDHQNNEDSLMKSFTPILTRPSIAAQYSPSSSPRGSITDLELRQVTLTRKDSGLIASHQLCEDTDSNWHCLIYSTSSVIAI